MNALVLLAIIAACGFGLYAAFMARVYFWDVRPHKTDADVQRLYACGDDDE